MGCEIFLYSLRKFPEVRTIVKENFLEEDTEMAQGHGKLFCDVNKANITIEISKGHLLC